MKSYIRKLSPEKFGKMTYVLLPMKDLFGAIQIIIDKYGEREYNFALFSNEQKLSNFDRSV